jgi:hypothetical protein
MGAAIGLGQLLNGDASRYTHAFILLDDGTTLGAYMGGAKIITLEEETRRHGQPGYLRYPLSYAQQLSVVSIARSYVGTPYSLVEYPALAAVRLGLPNEALCRYVADSHHMICSQLVDQIYLDAGIHLFSDGRSPGAVTPGDLGNLALELA